MMSSMKMALTLVVMAAAVHAGTGAATGAEGLVAAYAAQQKSETRVTPVQKVIQLLQGMLEKGKKEKQEEAVQYNSYKQWCDETNVEKTRAIAEANEMIDILKADIQKYTADAAVLSKEIAVHDEDISVWAGDMKAANNVREIEKTTYDATHKDYTESIDALGRAIAVLKKQANDKAQASFAQVSASLTSLNRIPEEAKRAIDVFLSQDPDDGLSVAAPEAAGYEFQSQGIIDMLSKLESKFVDEMTTLEKEEVNSVHAFKMLIQDLTAQTEQSTAERDEKAENKAKKLQARADATGTMQDTTATRDDDMKYLADVTATCEQKASDFASRQQLRSEESVAIAKAIEIMSSGAVSGAAEKHLPGLLQAKSASFAQLRSDGRSPTQSRVAEYLRVQAHQLNSRVLSAIAVRVDADPFKKVRKMIKELISKLIEEAAEEAGHKGWCDTELSTNEQTRKEKTEVVETLHAEIDELEAAISKLTLEITELTEGIAALDVAVAEATKMREEEKAKNTETIADAGEAQDAVAQALGVLKDFYAKAGTATAMVQQPEVFDSPYQGNQGAAGGVVGMLEVIQSDFARLEAETKAAEEQSQKEYDEFMTVSETDKAQKNKDIEHKVVKKQDKSQFLQDTKKDLEGTKEELDAALTYYDKLKPDCIDSGVSYEDRVARRKEEIESLQEALKILNGDSI